MLTEKQISEIREHLEKAQNPVFFYDNDADGLCSFLIFRRFIGRGKGVVVRSYPDLNAQYAKRAQELNADYVFILDKPVISREFVEEIDKMSIPIVWIDHHLVSEEDFKEFSNVNIYNPAKNKGKNKSEEPVSYLAYKITDRKEDIWIAVMGCIADHHLPDFASEFSKKYSEFWAAGIKRPFDAYFKSEIGKIARALNFGLKDSLTHVVHLQNFLISCDAPGDVLSELSTNKSFRDKYHEIKKKYDVLLEDAKKNVLDDLVFFVYGGELSISADLSNELSYIYPEKYIAVVYSKGSISNTSIRGKNIKVILERVLKQLNDASGGGHKDAVGARIKTKDLAKFREFLEKEISKE